MDTEGPEGEEEEIDTFGKSQDGKEKELTIQESLTNDKRKGTI